MKVNRKIRQQSRNGNLMIKTWKAGRKKEGRKGGREEEGKKEGGSKGRLSVFWHKVGVCCAYGDYLNSLAACLVNWR